MPCMPSVLSVPSGITTGSIVVNEAGIEYKVLYLNNDGSGTMAVQPVKGIGKTNWRVFCGDFCTPEERKRGYNWPPPEVAAPKGPPRTRKLRNGLGD